MPELELTLRDGLVRPGDPCWLVRGDNQSLPAAVPAAQLVRVDGSAVVLHDGGLYRPHEVFATEDAARRDAARSLHWSREYHLRQLELVEAAIRDLGDVDEPTTVTGEGS